MPHERTSWEHHRVNYRSGQWEARVDGGVSQALRKAHAGKFRVISEDRKWYDDDTPIAEYDEKEEAIDCASSHDTDDEWFFVYDDTGTLIWGGSNKKPRR